MEDKIQRLIDSQVHIFKQLKQINEKLESKMEENKELDCFEYTLDQYCTFDWKSISCEVLAKDNYGAIAVGHKGKVYKRRTNNKYGKSIFFSRGVKEDGKDTDYIGLCRFIDISNIAPLPNEIIGAITKSR